MVSENARDDGVYPAGEVAREILYRFAFPEPAFRAPEHDRPAAELADRNFESDARAERWLLKDHRDGLALQRLGKHRFRAKLDGKAQKGLKILAPQLAEGEKNG